MYLQSPIIAIVSYSRDTHTAAHQELTPFHPPPSTPHHDDAVTTSSSTHRYPDAWRRAAVGGVDLRYGRTRAMVPVPVLVIIWSQIGHLQFEHKQEALVMQPPPHSVHQSACWNTVAARIVLKVSGHAGEIGPRIQMHSVFIK